MRVLEINAIYGSQSTGTIVKNIQSTCLSNNIECYAAYSECYLPSSQVRCGYKIGNIFDYKLHAVLARIAGKMAYYSHIPTYFFLRYLDKIKPDVVHLHNLHGNYINLPMFLKYLAKNDIATVITMHDCWYFTGGCTHYTHASCNRWQQSCGSCPMRYEEVPALLYDGSSEILKDREALLNSIPRLAMIGCSKWISEECKKSRIRCSIISYIHNGFNTDIFKPLLTDNEKAAYKRKTGIPLDKKIILCPASKWYEERNNSTFSYFVDNLPDHITMVVFGCSEIGRNSSSKVKEIGYVKTPSEMAALYSCGDVMVNCSREDTLSSLNIECQACGTPVVAYDNTGTSETVHPGIGRLAETGDAKMLLKETLEVLSSQLAENKDVLVEWTNSNFEKQANYNKYIELFRSIQKNKSMRLNFFINTLGGGGAEKVLVDLVNLLPKDQYNITVTTLLHGIHEDKLASHIKHKCIIKTRNKTLIYLLERLYCKLFPYSFFAKLFLMGEYDVIVSYLEGFPARVVAAASCAKKKIVFVHCNTGVDKIWLSIYKSYGDCLAEYRTFDKVCFVSKDSLDGFQRVVGPLQNACVVHNVIDFKAALQKSLEPLDLIYSTKGLKIISVGRLSPVKGYDRLLRALSRLQKENYSFELWICGEGEQRAKLEGIIKNENIDNIHLLGFQGNPYKYMSKADLYICSSLSEAYSTSVAESVALGVPVLTTDCSGMREILNEGEYGDIVDNSEDGLYHGLRKILSDAQHYRMLKTNVTSRSKAVLEISPLTEYYNLFKEIS